MCYSHEASSYEETATTPLILRSSCTDAITASSKHTSVLEFQLKEMIISCIEAGGCKPAGENFDSIPSDVHIYSEEPVFQYDTVGFVVYSPATGNNKYVDLIMTSGDDDTTQVEIVGVHIALSPKHKETEASFFDTIDDWSDEWGNEDAKRKFVWILETIPPQKKRVEHVEASLGPGGEVLSPEYDIVYATIEEVSGITDEKLELIRWRADD